MKINAEFNTVEEMREFAELIGGTCKCSDKTVTVAHTEDKEAEKSNSKSDKKSTSKKAEKAKTEDKPKAAVNMKEEAKKKEQSKETPKVEAEKIGVDETSQEPPKDAEVTEEAPKVTKEQLRELCTRAVKSGKAAEVKKVFEKYGAKKLPEVKEADFAKTYKDVEALL